MDASLPACEFKKKTNDVFENFILCSITEKYHDFVKIGQVLVTRVTRFLVKLRRCFVPAGITLTMLKKVARGLINSRLKSFTIINVGKAQSWRFER